MRKEAVPSRELSCVRGGAAALAGLSRHPRQGSFQIRRLFTRPPYSFSSLRLLHVGVRCLALISPHSCWWGFELGVPSAPHSPLTAPTPCKPPLLPLFVSSFHSLGGQAAGPVAAPALFHPPLLSQPELYCEVWAPHLGPCHACPQKHPRGSPDSPLPWALLRSPCIVAFGVCRMPIPCS
nr:uncharacterized protein LOC129049850 [Pongo abelii]